jgi:hypothetical protein
MVCGSDQSSSSAEEHSGLQALRETFGEEEIQRQAGGQADLPEAEVLQQMLYGKLDGGADQGPQREERSEAVSQDSEKPVRSLREVGQPSECPPHGRRPAEQRPAELEDCLRLMPQSLSLAKLHGRREDEEALYVLRQTIREEADLLYTPESIEETWASLSEEAQGRVRLGFDASRWVRVAPFPLMVGAEARTMRLKGYGNAIVAQQATAFIEAAFACIAD